MAKGQGNFGNPEQHRRAGKLGAKAQPVEAKAKAAAIAGVAAQLLVLPAARLIYSM